MEATLLDMEKVTKATTTFLKSATTKAKEGETANLCQKLEEVLDRAKNLEANALMKCCECA